MSCEFQNDPQGRQALVDAMKSMSEQKLSHGTSGNISVRVDEGMLISPTGVHPLDLKPEQVVFMALDGTVGDDQLLPSSEWQMHASIYQTRAEAQAVVHCHSRHATILACARKDIPSFHYMIAAGGGTDIRCAPYATFGSDALAEVTQKALEGRFACLLANHGQIALGMSLSHALKTAAEVEEQAANYWGALAIGGPELLTKEEMDDVFVSFATYGQQRKS